MSKIFPAPPAPPFVVVGKPPAPPEPPPPPPDHSLICPAPLPYGALLPLLIKILSLLEGELTLFDSCKDGTSHALQFGETVQPTVVESTSLDEAAPPVDPPIEPANFFKPPPPPPPLATKTFEVPSFIIVSPPSFPFVVQPQQPDAVSVAPFAPIVIVYVVPPVNLKYSSYINAPAPPPPACRSPPLPPPPTASTFAQVSLSNFMLFVPVVDVNL